MDRTTLDSWRDLAIPDPATEPVDTELLTLEESQALDMLRCNGLRLEQERIPIDAAIAQLMTGP